MNSIRERILQTLVERLRSEMVPWPVLRSPTVPLTRNDSPALLVFVEGDTLTAQSNQSADRVLIVRLVALARGDEAIDQVDRMGVTAHAALMRDTTLGGLSLSLHETGCEWEGEDADAGAVAQPSRYEIRYRTHVLDLTRTG